MFRKYLDINPKVFWMPDYDLKKETDWYGIKALKYEGIEYKEQKTAVFAYIGYPENSGNKKVPGVVLVHGGGGHAYAEWVKIWNDRGYAAIAIDLRGGLPADDKKGLVGAEVQRDENFVQFDGSDGYFSGPDGYAVYDDETEIENVWLYRAVANTILAHNILLNDSRIDSEKIGITGISWGGVTVSQVIAHDKRFAFAIPIYGSGYLQFSLSEIMQPFKTEQALKYWDVSEKYDEIPFPVLWLCWNRDTCFDVIPNCLSYLKTKNAGAVLSICHEMNHAHWCGWVREESYRFADSCIGKAQKFIRFKNTEHNFFDGTFELECDSDGKDLTATLYYITEEYTYSEKSEPLFDWQTVRAEISGNTVFAKIPKDAKGYYIELKEKIGDKEYVSTSVFNKY